MKRRAFLQIAAGCLVGVGAPFQSGAFDVGSIAVGVAQALNVPGGDRDYRCWFIGLGEEGVSACNRFVDCNWPSGYPGEVGVRNEEGLSDALAGVGGSSGCVLVLSADDTPAMETALAVARVTQGRGALSTVAVLLSPPEVPWRTLAGEAAVRKLRA